MCPSQKVVLCLLLPLSASLAPLVAQTPAPATGLYATPLSSTVVQLSWLDFSDNETGFRVERRLPGEAWSTVSTTGADATILRITSGQVAGTTYLYRVTAVNGSNAATPTSEASATTPPASEVILDDNVAPTVVVGNWNTIYLQPRDSWGSRGLEDRNRDKGTKSITFTGSVPTDGSYDVFQFLPTQANHDGVPFDITHSGGTTRVLTDQGALDAGWSYIGTYSFTADTPFVVQLLTEGTTATVVGDAVRLAPAPTVAPAAVESFVATPRGPGRIDLSWTDLAANEHGYRVQIAPAGSEDFVPAKILPPNANRTEITGLPADSSWQLRIRAENSAGSSDWVAVSAATTTARTRRLWVTENRLTEIRAAAAVPGSHHHQAIAAMKARVDQADWRVYDENSADGNWNYARAWLAREAAFLYLLEGIPTYAATAYRALRDMYDLPDPDRRLPDSGYSNGSNADLSRAATGIGFALAYDFAGAGWTSEQRDWVRSKLESAAEAWPSVGVPNSGHPQISNHVAVARSGELIILLALDQEQSRPERMAQLKSWLRTHLQNAYTPTGWTQEGVGYAAYAGAFLVPAIKALESVGDLSLSDDLARCSFWKLPMYNFLWTASPTNGQMMVLQNGVDSGAPGNQEGWSSALFATVPPALLPAYRAWYDRALGIDSPLPAAGKFDFRRAGTMWAALYYPTTGVTAPPASLLPLYLADTTGGFVMLRNRWQDEDDVQLSLFGDTRGASKAWDSPEAMQLNLAGFGAKFIGGPGKQTSAPYFSTLLIDGKNHVATTDTGSLVSHTPFAEGGGTVVVSGGNKVTKLGVTGARRELYADFSGRGAPAILGLLDTVTSVTAHTYTANFALADDSSNGGLQARSVPAGSRSAFTITAPSGGWLRGWVLSHDDAVLRVPADGSNDPLQVEVAGTNVDLMIVFAMGRGEVPAGTVTGTGKDAVLALPGARVRYDSVTAGFVVEAALESPYLAWLEQRFGAGASSDPELSAPTADPDRDGIPNLLAYALGVDTPGTGPRPIPTARPDGSGGQDVVLQWTRPIREGVLLTAQVAPSPAGPWSTAEVTEVSTTEGTVTEEVTLPSAGGFIRLVATESPPP